MLCKRCGVEFEQKPWQAKTRKNFCLDCYNTKIREARRRYADKNRDVRIDARKEYRRRNAEATRAKQNAHRQTEDGKLKYSARTKLQYAVRKGRIIKPAICPRCGLPGWIQGHHTDYNKPFDVTWLCSKCHGLEHRKPASS